ncbi:MAG: hypothetical protein O3A46_04330, partial [Candidatus Poribacteria bacterium]|nr:hypothetical protein [Candidatus Poribacteria bacterium]
IIQCGVAYHHAGMLPTLKEVVERLFTLGKIQLLFTTETFAVGINMPARSVIFESLEKYDGISFRYLKAREYQQMAGRAGRRGIDECGYVYAIVHPDRVQIPQVEHVLLGEPEPIESQFNLSYSSILNLLQEHGDRMFEVCRKSFGNYQSSARIQLLRRQIQQTERQRKQMEEPHCIYGGDAMTLLTQFQNVSLAVQEEIDELRPVRSRIKRRYSGRKKKRDRVKRLGQVNRQEGAIRKQLDVAQCHGCDNLNECRKRYSDQERSASKLSNLHEEIVRVENYQKDQIERRLKVLTTLGYIDGIEVFPRGEIAQQLYGYELQITQLAFAGYLESLDPDALNVLAVSLIFESKRDQWTRRLEDGPIRRLLRNASKAVDRIRILEAEYGVDTLTQPLDPGLASATLAWSRGAEFDALLEYTGATEGDLVRMFRSGADLLRQIRRAMSDHPTLPDTLLDAIKKLNRDIVDAERQLRVDFEGESNENGSDANNDTQPESVKPDDVIEPLQDEG